MQICSLLFDYWSYPTGKLQQELDRCLFHSPIYPSFGYFLSSILVDLINSITKGITPSKQGWLNGDNLNDNNLNHFYWFLAILGSLNSANYLYWASWFKYKKDNSESGIKSRTQNGSFYNIEETTQMLK